MNRLYTLFMFIFPLLSSAQCVEGDCLNGNGSFKFLNGTYVGQFIESELSGKGAFQTRKGYSYDGSWAGGKKNGYGIELIKRGSSYEGQFKDDLKDGDGKAIFPDNKFISQITYNGQWSGNQACGLGELSYLREVKYGRDKVIEKNVLEGEFVNGVFQGELIQNYFDEQIWSSTALKSGHFQLNKDSSLKNFRKLKNLSEIEGYINVECECRSNLIVASTSSKLRKGKSWLSDSIPPKTKSSIIQSKQREFDIIEWYARELEAELNNSLLVCEISSMQTIFEYLKLKEKDLKLVRKQYSLETAWNPLKGVGKNPAPQQKWNKKIDAGLSKAEKKRLKAQKKIEKKISKINSDNCFVYLLEEHIPQKEVPVVAKEPKPKREPIELRFTRKNQLQ